MQAEARGPQGELELGLFRRRGKQWGSRHSLQQGKVWAAWGQAVLSRAKGQSERQRA